MILLDTHVWVWMVEGESRRIGARTRRWLKRALDAESIQLSMASVFEVAALSASGRLRFAQSVDSWIEDAVAAARGRLIEISRDIAIDAGRISRTSLPDPMDRFIVATARDGGATLLTCDRVILDHSRASRSLRVEDAGR